MQDLELFTQEVRDFLAEHLTPELRRAGELCAGIYAEKPVGIAWQRILDQEKGWAVPAWPEAWGGTGWSLGGAPLAQTAKRLLFVRWRRTMVTACASDGPSAGPTSSG